MTHHVLQTHIRNLYLLGCDIRIKPVLRDYVWMRVGGPAPYLVAPKTIYAMERTLQYCHTHNIPYKILGAGSNLLICDAGCTQVIISTKNIGSYHITHDGTLVADAGAALASIALTCAQQGRGGLSFACGIPGTCGGGVYMNAGAYGGSIMDTISHVTVFDAHTQSIQVMDASDCQFGYRTSIFQQSHRYIILKAQFTLIQSTIQNEQTTIDTLLRQRRNKQPLERPSAGSIFKRPRPDFYVGTAIEAQGLKGMRIGGAQISTKHAGFIINRNNATYHDILALIQHIQQTIYTAYGEHLKIEPQRRE